MSPLVFSSVGPPYWSDKPAIVVGTGPSLKEFDFNELRGLGYILAVKNSVFDIPFADACFGLDLGWMKREQDKLRKLTMELVLAVPDGIKYHEQHIANATYIRRIRRADSFSEDPRFIECGGNSGFGAMNWVFLKRPKQIFCFGYDYGGRHYCSERYAHLPQNAHFGRYLPRWGRAFHRVARQLQTHNIRVVVASSHSNITCFERMNKNAALECLRRLRSERSGSVRSGEGEFAPALHDPNAYPRPSPERVAGERAVLAPT